MSNGSARRLTVGIIGGGLGGITMAVQLAKRGIDFTVFEQSQRPGGVWNDNTYPGCEVDVPSLFYSFSFFPYDWPSRYASHDVLQRYAEDTIDHFEIRDSFRFGATVVSAGWDDEAQVYCLRLADGSEPRFNIVVSAAGFLNRPRYPDWPGLEQFAGPKFHTARWEHDQDLRGKTIALVGTGSTAIQATPHLAEKAKHLYVYQREPGWIVPKRAKPYRASTRRRRRRLPWTQKVERFGIYLAFDGFVRTAFKAGSRRNRFAERLCRRHIETNVSDPQLRELVTPTHPFGCKRPIFDDHWYAALQRDNVTLVPHAVESVTADGVVAADGITRPADVLIMATGFHTQNYISHIQVRGAGGRDLHAVWGDEPTAFLGMTVKGFPNFFILYGPNTNGGPSGIFQIERQASAVTAMIGRLQRSGATALDTRQGAFDRYDAWIDAQSQKNFSAAAYCNNYYFSPTGRNVTQWPRGGLDYWALTRILLPRAMAAKQRGRPDDAQPARARGTPGAPHSRVLPRRVG